MSYITYLYHETTHAGAKPIVEHRQDAIMPQYLDQQLMNNKVYSYEIFFKDSLVSRHYIYQPEWFIKWIDEAKKAS